MTFFFSGLYLIFLDLNAPVIDHDEGKVPNAHLKDT